MQRTLLVEIDAADVRYDEFDLSAEKRGMLIAAGRLAVENCLGHLLAVAAGRGALDGEPEVTVRPSSYDALAESGASEVMARANSRLSSEVRDRVFISYARDDRSWVDRFQVALKGTLRNKPVLVWDDSQLGRFAVARWLGLAARDRAPTEEHEGCVAAGYQQFSCLRLHQGRRAQGGPRRCSR